jgi:hypothetical protein
MCSVELNFHQFLISVEVLSFMLCRLYLGERALCTWIGSSMGRSCGLGENNFGPAKNQPLDIHRVASHLLTVLRIFEMGDLKYAQDFDHRRYKTNTFVLNLFGMCKNGGLRGTV